MDNFNNWDNSPNWAISHMLLALYTEQGRTNA